MLRPALLLQLLLLLLGLLMPLLLLLPALLLQQRLLHTLLILSLLALQLRPQGMDLLLWLLWLLRDGRLLLLVGVLQEDVEVFI